MIDQAKLRSIPTDALRDLHRTVVAELNDRQRRAAFAAGRAFKPGDRVKWHSKEGRVITGEVTKVNTISVGVRVVDSLSHRVINWRVAPSFLQHA